MCLQRTSPLLRTNLSEAHKNLVEAVGGRRSPLVVSFRRCCMSEQGNTKRRHEQTSRNVVYAAVVAHLSIAAAKWVAAALTRSSAMLAEAIYPTVDTGNELLLLESTKLRPASCILTGTARLLFLYSAGSHLHFQLGRPRRDVSRGFALSSSRAVYLRRAELCRAPIFSLPAGFSTLNNAHVERSWQLSRQMTGVRFERVD